MRKALRSLFLARTRTEGRWTFARYSLVALAAAVSVWLAACRPPPATRAQVAGPAGPAGATLFQVDAGASQLWFYLRADGPLAKLGHNHVISSHGLRGSVWVHPQTERSSCDLQLPVATFVVDDPQERAAAGGEFAEPLDAAARDGTRDHMLGDRQLDAAHFPLLHVRCRQLTGTPDGLLLELAVTLRDHESRLSVPVQWQRSGKLLQARGEFTFRQSELGLEPYSLLFGALRVADEIHARFQLVAREP